MVWRTLIALVAVAFAMSFGFFYYLNSRGVSEDTLRQRCETAQPAWQSYQEDIKGQIGAGPVAEWHGRPVVAEFRSDAIKVNFEVQGNWAMRKAGLPILLRMPTGEVISGSLIFHDGTLRTYQFPLDASLGQPPWAELRYPHQTVRILPDEAGLWTAPDA